MSNKKKTIAFTGGGTAGHVFPAFPVIDRVRKDGFEVFWIGSSDGMERKLIESAGVRYYGIPSGKFRRYFSLKNMTDLFNILAGFYASRRILRRERPAVLMSKGGFVSVPPAAAARTLGIPCVTHESDVDPGLATRLNLKLGARALTAYEKTLEWLSPAARKTAVVVGNPIRDTLLEGNAQEGRRIAGLDSSDSRPLILVLGGSQGAREVNDLIDGILDLILPLAAVVHQRGAGNPGRPDGGGYLSRPFFNEELPHLLAAADLAVARSGAGTVWELAATGTPAIFIPLRDATRGDQILNAAMADEAGMSFTLEKGAGPADLEKLVSGLLTDKKRLAAMSAAASAYPARGAADRISGLLKEYFS
jgi:UDP-N-acetylglucosamine--N-acetylmuramyl-(pentapeptide) pyrophosphoryl-undecaprenol N-acetylglucosamine transferase